MTRIDTDPQRRRLLGGLGALGVLAAAPGTRAAAPAANTAILQRVIPASGEQLPAVGMGTWLTFDVGRNHPVRDQRIDVLRALFDHGGHLVDSSPMYGSSEAVLGHCLGALGDTPLFAATKVWIMGRQLGVRQMSNSEKLWGGNGLDLIQVHNMMSWETHLATLREWKADERIRYIGITTSHGRRHGEMAKVIANEPDFDFVQFTYNLADREAETRLLPLAADNGKAVIINRPFRTGRLIDVLEGRPLPAWAGELGATSWAQYLLKFVVSHPAVTCCIPATTRVDHMIENLAAATGPLPDAPLRARMARHFDSL